MEVILRNGGSALIDDEDAALVIGLSWSWSQNKNVKYVRSGRRYLHRVIARAKPGEIVDHINGDGLDNRKSNLRITNHQGNKANSHNGKYTSKFIGVSKMENGKYRSMAKLHGRVCHLGVFDSEESAAKAYDKFVLAHRGSLCVINFPEK